MTDRKLPPPITITDEYLAAIHDRLGDILDRLPTQPTGERVGGTVELTEPKRPVTAKAKPKAAGGDKREPGGRSPRPAQRRKPAPKSTD